MEEGEGSLGQGGSLPYDGLEAHMDLWGNVLRSPSRRTNSSSLGEGSGRTMELRMDGDMHNEEMHWARGRKVAPESERGRNNPPGKQGIVDCPVRE